MIEIKRSCNSSIRNEPEKQQIIFSAFTIKITEDDWQLFDCVLQDCKLKPAEALEELIYAALDMYNTKLYRASYGVSDVHDPDLEAAYRGPEE